MLLSRSESEVFLFNTESGELPPDTHQPIPIGIRTMFLPSTRNTDEGKFMKLNVRAVSRCKQGSCEETQSLLPHTTRGSVDFFNRRDTYLLLTPSHNRSTWSVWHTSVCIGRQLGRQMCVSAELCRSSMARLDTQMCVSAELWSSMAGLDRQICL
jgi:hypothetical protein